MPCKLGLTSCSAVNTVLDPNIPDTIHQTPYVICDKHAVMNIASKSEFASSYGLGVKVPSRDCRKG